MNFEIRRATENDAQKIYELVCENHLSENSDGCNGFFLVKLSREDYCNLAKNADYAFVAEYGGLFAGFTIGFPLKKTGELGVNFDEGIEKLKTSHLDGLLVFQTGISEKFRRHGLASALYNKMFGEANGKCGCAYLFIGLKPLNFASVEFHKKQGFSLVFKEEVVLCGKPVVDGLFEKKL